MAIVCIANVHFGLTSFSVSALIVDVQLLWILHVPTEHTNLNLN